MSCSQCYRETETELLLLINQRRYQTVVNVGAKSSVNGEWRLRDVARWKAVTDEEKQSLCDAGFGFLEVAEMERVPLQRESERRLSSVFFQWK